MENRGLELGGKIFFRLNGERGFNINMEFDIKSPFLPNSAIN